MSNSELQKDDIEVTSIESKKTDRKNAFLWYSYDMADTFFSQTVISIAFTPFALLLGAAYEWGFLKTFIIVSVFMAGSNLLVALISPFIGAISDTLGKRKPVVIIVASIMVTITMLITIWENFWWACILFVIANFMYQTGRMLYDSQIPFIAETKDRSIVQSIGGALAALGSIIGVVLSLVINGLGGQPLWSTVNTNLWDEEGFGVIELGNLRWLFLAAGILIILMSIPYLFHKEQETPSNLKPRENLKKSRRALIDSFKTIFKDRNSVLFIIGWFFLVDAANTTILFMVPVIQGAVGVTSSTITYIIILVGILLSVVFGFVTGHVLKRVGPKITFLISGLAWIGAVGFTMLAGWQLFGITTPWWLMFFGAVLIGVGFGSIWIIGRQFIMVLAPPAKLAQYNGFQKIAGRVSAIVSPLIFSAMMFLGMKTFSLDANDSFRIALGTLVVFFAIDMILVAFIRDPYKRYNAGERAPYEGIYAKKAKASEKLDTME